MPRILVSMSSRAFRTVFEDATLKRLRELGDLERALDPAGLDGAVYRELWVKADYVISGWGVRPPQESWLDACRSLKGVFHAAGSVRMFPRALIERGVLVTSARAAIARTVAEHCLAVTLSLLRNMASYDSRTEQALAAAGAPSRPATRTLYGKTVALIGFGHVARHFRELLRPFDVSVLVTDPYADPDAAASHNVHLVSLHEALRTADVVSLHAPDTPATAGLIGREELQMLRDGCIFVNTARGRLVDTAALTAELATGRFSAALDVTDPEPLPPDHPLRGMPNVLLTPHIAGPTSDDLPRLGAMAVCELERALSGQPPLYPIDATAYDRMSF